MNKILEKISEWSIKTPKQLCFDGLNDQLTYQELEEKSDNLAVFLKNTYPDNQTIIVYGGHSSEMTVCFIACTKAGHGYVPVDAHTPDDRLKMIIEEAKACTVLAMEEWPLETAVISKDKYQKIIENNLSDLVLKPVTSTQNYYTIFTSGTTGKPKGVQISYDNLLSYTNWMLTDFELKTGQRFLCQAPFSFDLSVMDLYPALLTGGTLVPLHKKEVDHFPTLFKRIPELKINVWVSTPSMIEICLLSPDFNSEKLPELENFQFCGEELPRPVAIKLMERFPNALIFNTYGPTEATVAVTGIKLTNELMAKVDRLPLGLIKSDSKLLIMNDAQTVLPEGEIGEIVIVGPSVSKGYFNNSEKTQASFFEYEGEQAYRTGDAGLLKNELLFYKGRLDFQVKWHGFRIELGDIDHHLLLIDSVRSACVVPKYNKLGKIQQLIAFVVLEDSLEEIDVKEQTKQLKKELGLHVMDYMVPQKFEIVTSLPLSINGKVDRKALISQVNPT